MSTTSALTGAATTASQVAKTVSSAAKLNQNYEMFLELLTAQIKNQNPLEPLDANKFTEQLVQYSGIEQQIQMNQQLEDMKKIIATNNASTLVSYVGTNVTAESTTTELRNGQASWRFTMPKAGTADVVIRNADGAVVHRESRELAADTFDFVWDGKTTNGTQAPAGTYQISIAGRDADGGAIAVSTMITGTVSEVDFSGAEPMLKIGSQRIPLSSVRAVAAAL